MKNLKRIVIGALVLALGIVLIGVGIRHGRAALFVLEGTALVVIAWMVGYAVERVVAELRRERQYRRTQEARP